MDGIVRAWVDGWVVSRGAAPPVPRPWGFTVDVGLEAQVSRHVLAATGDEVEERTVREVAGAVTGTGIWLKVFQDPALVGKWLAEDWWVDPEPGWLMTLPLATDGDRAVPLNACGDRPAPLTVDGGQPVPLGADGDRPAPLTVDGGQPIPLGADGDRAAPLRADSDPLASPTADADRDAQASTDGERPAPLTADGDRPQPLAPDDDRPAHLPDGYRLRRWTRGGVTRVLVAAPDGSLAARGQVAPTGATAVFDQIATTPAHRRRGLGSLVMRTLTAVAAAEGATTGVLAGTPDGRALYESLGWRTEAPLTSARYTGPAA